MNDKIYDKFDEKNSQYQHSIKSYGRTVGKSLSQNQIAMLKNYIETNDINEFQKKFNKFILEIGFGNGENILELQQKFPNFGIIGVEPFKNSCVKMIKILQENAINNLFIVNDDVKNYAKTFETLRFEQVFVLFPDPWPKKKHNKRRLLQEDFLKFIAKIAQEFRFASDDYDYFHFVQNLIQTENLFEKVEIFSTKPENFSAKTRYEAKAIENNIPPKYLICSHENI